MRYVILFGLLLATVSLYADDTSDLPKWFSIKNTNTAAPVDPTPSDATTKPQPIKKSAFDGSKLAVGYVANTGNTNSRNIDLGGVLKYVDNRWSYRELTTYEKQEDSVNGTTQNKFYSQGRAQFAINNKDYFYGQLSYLNNQFDGYVYVYDENLGYGHYFSMPASMTFDVFLGPGLRQRKLIESAGGTFSNEPDMQFGTEYLWRVSSNATFHTRIQTEVAGENTHTDVSTGVTSIITNHLALSVNYDVGYDTKPVVSKKATNTTTTVQMLYNF